MLTAITSSEPSAPSTRRARLAVLALVAIGAIVGWIWLGLVVASMLPMTDMGTLGPGMGLFNRLNQFAGLPPDLVAALAALCLPSDAHFGMPGSGPWGLRDLGLVFAMWQAMVLAMMLPSAAPALAREAARTGRGPVALAAGYLAAWTLFACVATLAQWGLTELRAINAAMGPASLVLSATTLVAAGLYQFTPLKVACLARCRVPAPLFLGEAGAPSPLRAGWQAGLDCLGCCWALMAVMFAVGVMNVAWIAVLGAVMALEKLASGPWPSRIIGLALILWGAMLIVASPIGVRLVERFFV